MSINLICDHAGQIAACAHCGHSVPHVEKDRCTRAVQCCVGLGVPMFATVCVPHVETVAPVDELARVTAERDALREIVRAYLVNHARGSLPETEYCGCECCELARKAIGEVHPLDLRGDMR
jgi:hypothetical protein